MAVQHIRIVPKQSVKGRLVHAPNDAPTINMPADTQKDFCCCTGMKCIDATDGTESKELNPVPAQAKSATVADKTNTNKGRLIHSPNDALTFNMPADTQKDFYCCTGMKCIDATDGTESKEPNPVSEGAKSAKVSDKTNTNKGYKRKPVYARPAHAKRFRVCCCNEMTKTQICGQTSYKRKPVYARPAHAKRFRVCCCNEMTKTQICGQTRERLDMTDLGPLALKSSGGFGQPFKKEYDDTLSQTMVATLHEQMKSVGVLVSNGNIVGTVFRCGTCCVMTAFHVVRSILDPGNTGDVDLSRLTGDNTFINFNESAVAQPVVLYRIKENYIFKEDLDVAVLEISNPSNLPMKMTLRKPKSSENVVTDVSLIGYGHTNHTKKCLDPKCEILSPNSQRMQSAFRWLQQNLGNYKSAMQQTVQDPNLVDSGYHGYDHPTKIIFNCFMEHGGSGAPAVTNANERSVDVVAILTHGLPEFYFKLSREIQAVFPKQYRFELGTSMTSIYEWIRTTQPESLLKDLFN